MNNLNKILKSLELHSIEYLKASGNFYPFASIMDKNKHISSVAFEPNVNISDMISIIGDYIFTKLKSEEIIVGGMAILQQFKSSDLIIDSIEYRILEVNGDELYTYRPYYFNNNNLFISNDLTEKPWEFNFVSVKKI
jgi:hypothetical protein